MCMKNDNKTLAENVEKYLFTLTAHMETHIVKHFICDICEMGFSEESNLAIHMRSHGQELHKCSECGAGFSNKFYLTRHLRTHMYELEKHIP